MICPYCDNEYRIAAAPQVCSHCGAQLPSYDEILERRHINGRNLTFPEAPIGIYKDAAGYLEIGRDSVTLFRRHFVKGHKRVIPFCEIYSVSYGTGAPMHSGFLCVREWKDRNLPLATDSLAVITDETSVYFHHSKNDEFRRVYEFLKECTEIVHAANPDWTKDGLLPLMGKYRGFYGYMELGLDSVTFCKKNLFAKRTVRIVPYSEIYDVTLKEAKGSNTGGILVRERKDRTVPTRGSDYAAVEETGIDFDRWYNERMRQVYEFLDSCAKGNRCTPSFVDYEAQKAALEKIREVYCPVCFSTSIVKDQSNRCYPYFAGGLRNPKMRVAASVVRLLLVTADAMTGGTVKCVCLKCGHKWNLEKK